MSEGMTEQMMAAAERLAAAAEALGKVLERLDAQQAALNAKVDRIVAAVEEQAGEANSEGASSEEGAANKDEGRQNEPSLESAAEETLQARVAELEQANADLKAQAARMTRKTLSPTTTALLAKNSGEGGERFDAAAIERSLQPLTIEQRIAVKAEMARAGIID